MLQPGLTAIEVIPLLRNANPPRGQGKIWRRQWAKAFQTATVYSLLVLSPQDQGDDTTST